MHSYSIIQLPKQDQGRRDLQVAISAQMVDEDCLLRNSYPWRWTGTVELWESECFLSSNTYEGSLDQLLFLKLFHMHQANKSNQWNY